MSQKKSQKLSVFLLKGAPANNFLTYLKTSEVTEFEIKDEFAIRGKIYCGVTSEQQPAWVGFLNQGAKKNLPHNLVNSSNKAILLFENSNRVFAITFGYGRYLLDDEFIERNFGLKVVLNSVNPDKLKSIDLSNLDDLTLQTRKQTSKGSSKEAFGLDIISDLMKAVTGTPSDRLLGGTLNGRDQVNLSPKIVFRDLKKIIKKISDYYDSDNYKTDFEWIDNVRIEKDLSKINKLNSLLVKEIQKEVTDKIYLSVPEILDWEKIPKFSYTEKGNKFDELDIRDYFEKVGDTDVLDLAKLKNHKVFVHSGNDDEGIPKWSIYNCMNFEKKLGNELFCLAMGSWYKIKDSFVNETYEYVRQIPISNIVFVEHKAGESEGQYNKKLADSNKKKYTLMDAKNVYCELAKSSIEPCDVFTNDKQFIHVKKKYSSATLSHLFAQGRISAEAFLSDREFRKGIRRNIKKEKRLNQNLIPLTTKIESQDYEIIYAVIDKSNKDVVSIFPFFSLLNLKQSYHSLSLMGFKVSIAKIKSSSK